MERLVVRDHEVDYHAPQRNHQRNHQGDPITVIKVLKNQTPLKNDRDAEIKVLKNQNDVIKI